MNTLTTILAVAALATAIAAVAIADKRHKRVRRRLLRLDRRCDELMQLLKATAARVNPSAHGPVTLRSQFGEDLLLLELLDWKPDGFYIEVGAYDGKTYSVSAALEQLGWDGLLIEPVPDLYEKAKANRPNARVVHAAASRRGSSGTTSMTHLVGGHDYDASSHLTPSDGAALKRPPSGVEVRTVEVPLTTVDALLEGHTERVDIASIDVEGHELDLLDGFDLDRYQPAVVLIEDHSLADTSPIHAYLTQRGYTQTGWLHWNRVMVRTDRPDVLARAEALAQHTAHRDA